MRKMKDSGIDWIGRIPENWNIKPIGSCFKERNERVSDYNWKPLSVTKQGIVEQLETAAKSDAHDDRKKVCIGDFVINSRSDRRQSSGLSELNGSVSLINIVLENKELEPKYVKYLLKNYGFAEEFYRWGNGIVSDLWSTNYQRMKRIMIPIPKKEEQKKIGEFLDKKVTEVDDVMSKVLETIKDYRKYKVSYIKEVFDKNLKRSNKIENKKIGQMASLVTKQTGFDYSSTIKPSLRNTPEDNTLPYLQTRHFKDNHFIYDTEFYIPEKVANMFPKIVLDKKCLLFSIVGASIGNVAIFPGNVKAFLGGAICKVELIDDSLYDYIKIYMISEYGQQQIFSKVNSNAQGTITVQNVRDFIIPIPDKKIQQKIVSEINNKISVIDNLIVEKEKNITELENYRKSLVYEYITGKKEVKFNKFLSIDNLGVIKVKCKDDIFAQAILLCRIIEKLNKYKLGRVKAEKTLYLIEKDIGFDFNNNYVREAAGPLCDAIYKCESIISKKNKWVKVKNIRKHIEYEMLEDFNKYEKYYEKYYSNYDNKIEKIIEIIKKCSTDEAEMIATLYASWNDFIIKGEKASDIQIVKDVRENWNDSKKRFDEEKWLNVLNKMKKVGLVPKGYGNLTIIKEQ